jgi:transposase
MQKEIHSSVVYTHYIGVDVSKDYLDISWLLPERDLLKPVVLSSKTQWHDERCVNAPGSILTFLRVLDATFDKSAIHITLEFTGVYSAHLVYLLHQENFNYSVIGGLQSSAFANVKGITTRNDRFDARLLALYGQQERPFEYTPPSDMLQKARQIRMALRQFKKQHRALSNQSLALDKLPCVLPKVKNMLIEHIDMLKKSISELEKELYDLTEHEFKALLELAQSVKGVSEKTATALIIHTNGLKNFETSQQLLKFSGLVPKKKESGNTRKKGTIMAAANPEIRQCLYMGALSAIRGEGFYKTFYNGLRQRGKSAKLALIAVAAKMLKHLFVVIKSGQKFDYQRPEKEALAYANRKK